jgi:hypothetical protein
VSTAAAVSPVAPITLPVSEGLFRILEADGVGEPGSQWPVVLASHKTIGTWVPIALRADFSIANRRTYWVTLEWRPPRD